MADFPQEELLQKILSGNLRALARAATWIEKQTVEGRSLVASLFPYTGRALTVGFTGPPGAGKSTLVNQLIKLIREQNKTVGVIATDPSSPFSGGSILGDRIRMSEHHRDPGVFIRSTATRGYLGGVARNTLELALLFDAAGRDVVFIETVGVGQDEIAVAQLADVTIVVLVPGLGDDIQTLKAGILEIADVFALNKSDLPGMDRLEQELSAMQSLGGTMKQGGPAPIRRVAACDGKGVAELWSAIIERKSIRELKDDHVEIWALRLRSLLQNQLDSELSTSLLLHHAERVAYKKEDPYQAVNALWRSLLETSKAAH